MFNEIFGHQKFQGKKGECSVEVQGSEPVLSPLRYKCKLRSPLFKFGS